MIARDFYENAKESRDYVTEEEGDEKWTTQT